VALVLALVVVVEPANVAKTSSPNFSNSDSGTETGASTTDRKSKTQNETK
jgi:hypothetical protein